MITDYYIDEVIMTTLTPETFREQKINRAREALQRARALSNTIKEFGVDGICQHVEDVDGDWLEKWSVEESSNSCSDADEEGYIQNLQNRDAPHKETFLIFFTSLKKIINDSKKGSAWIPTANEAKSTFEGREKIYLNKRLPLFSSFLKKQRKNKLPILT